MSATLIGFDTSNAACGCALWCDGEVLERYHEAPRGHGELLLPMVESLLAEAGLALRQVDALVLGQGPGSFTGLRIAAGVAQGLAFAIDCPVVPVSSLAALAQVAAGERVAPAFDARMGEVYWGAYQRGDDGLVKPVLADAVAAPGQVECPPGGDWVGVGEGWLVHGDALSGALAVAGCRVEVSAQPRFPRGRGVVELGARDWRQGAGMAPERVRPVYLRNKVV